MHPGRRHVQTTLGSVSIGAAAEQPDVDANVDANVDVDEPVPLARLLAMAYRAMIEGLQERLRSAGWRDVRPPYGFVLLAARDAPSTTGDLAALIGITKQATSKLLDQMEAARYIRRNDNDADGRVEDIELAARGRRLLAEVEGIYAELEGEWADVVGVTSVRPCAPTSPGCSVSRTTAPFPLSARPGEPRQARPAIVGAGLKASATASTAVSPRPPRLVTLSEAAVRSSRWARW